MRCPNCGNTDVHPRHGTTLLHCNGGTEGVPDGACGAPFDPLKQPPFVVYIEQFNRDGDLIDKGYISAGDPTLLTADRAAALTCDTYRECNNAVREFQRKFDWRVERLTGHFQTLPNA